MGHAVNVIPIECEFGPISAFVYYIDAPEPALVDTAISTSPDEDIAPALAAHGIRMEDIRWILLTHGHVDHHGGARRVWEMTGRRANVVIPKQDANLLRSRDAYIAYYHSLQGKFFGPELHEKHIADLMHEIGGELEPTHEVVHGDRLSLGDGVTLRVVETPGHSLGSTTFVLEELNWAFAADAVQIHGGAKSGIPTVEYPSHYRRSLKHLLEVVQPKRMFLGHRFRGASGAPVYPVLEGEAVTKAIQDSLEKEAQLCEIARRHLSGGQPAEHDERFGPYKSIAEEIGYNGDPRFMPCSFLVTMNGYQEEFQNPDNP